MIDPSELSVDDYRILEQMAYQETPVIERARQQAVVGQAILKPLVYPLSVGAGAEFITGHTKGALVFGLVAFLARTLKKDASENNQLRSHELEWRQINPGEHPLPPPPSEPTIR
jgi:hypothetical protein